MNKHRTCEFYLFVIELNSLLIMYYICVYIIYSERPCNDAYSFCGLKDQLYPDRRAMGYPFDRSSRIQGNSDVESLATFAQQLPNAVLGECTIRFTDTIISRTA